MRAGDGKLICNFPPPDEQLLMNYYGCDLKIPSSGTTSQEDRQLDN